MQGEYLFTVRARDRFNPQRSDSITLRVPVQPVATAAPVLSDLEFATSIRMNPPTQGQFYKNTLEVVPNVGGIFTEEQRCFYYAEAYNLVRGTDTDRLRAPDDRLRRRGQGGALKGEAQAASGRIKRDRRPVQRRPIQDRDLRARPLAHRYFGEVDRHVGEEVLRVQQPISASTRRSLPRPPTSR